MIIDLIRRGLALLVLVLLAVPTPAQGGHSEAGDLVARGHAAIEALRFDEAVDLLGRALEAAGDEAELLADRIEAHRLRSLAHEQLRDLVAARADAEAALRLCEQDSIDGDEFRLVGFLQSLARLCAKTDREAAAIDHYARALALARKTHPKDLEIQLALLHPLARLQRQARDHEAAIASLQSYVATIEELRGELHADTSQPLWELSLSHRLCGDPAAAIPVLERWIAVYEKVKGEGDPSTAKGVAAIVDCRLALGLLDEAEKGCLRWLELLEKVTKKHPDAVLVLERLARIENERGRGSDEIAHLEDAIRRGRALEYPDQVRDAGLMRRLAAACRREGRLEEARKAIDESMALAARYLPAGDPERQLVRLERGRVHEARGDLRAAETDFRAVLEAFETMAGKSHPALLEPLRCLADLARREKRADDAAAFDARIKAIEKSD